MTTTDEPKVEEIADRLHRAGIRRACFSRPNLDWAHDGSHPGDWTVTVWNRKDERVDVACSVENGLGQIRDALVSSRDLHAHEMLWVAPYRGSGGASTTFIISVHSTVRGSSQGGTRFWRYESFGRALADSLRLAEGMTRKSALAGLWWGGGKSVIPRTSTMGAEFDQQSTPRRDLFLAFADLVAHVGGLYYAAEDMGTVTADMNTILTACRFVTCIGREKGGSGNPSPFTAQAVLHGIEAALPVIDRSLSMKGLDVSVQGAGNVGLPLIELLSAAGATVSVADYWDRPEHAQVHARLQELRGVTTIPAESAYEQRATVFCPCATGGTVNSDTIPRLAQAGVRLIIGAANNILADPPADSRTLLDHKIAYVPDFLINSGGIANCADEPFGYLQLTVSEVINHVPELTERVLAAARRYKITTLAAAEIMADEAARRPNPLHPGRSQRILKEILTAQA